MKKGIICATVLCTMLLLASGFAQCDTFTATFIVANKANDGATSTHYGLTNLGRAYEIIGKGNVLGWRFENVSIPKGAKISNARLGVFCNAHEYGSIKLKYSGESSDNATPLTTAKYELINRAKTSATVIDAPAPWTNSAWNNSPDLAAIVQEIVNRSGWQSGNAMLLFAEDSGSFSIRNVFMFDRSDSYGAKLTITYDDSPPVTECKFDTNRDGIPDIILYDTDGDGYCEVPPGKIEYTGVLIMDKPLEIMGAPGVSRTGVLFKGDGFVMAQGGVIISELVLHPEKARPGGDYPGIKGLDLEIVTKSSIQFEYLGEIFLGGTGEGEFAGDILLQTTRQGASIILQSDCAQEFTYLYGRNIHMVSEGSIQVTGKFFVLGSSIVLEARQGDIHLRRSSLWTSGGRGYSIILKTLNGGDVNLTGGVELSADVIDMCGVTGDKNDDGTTHVIGKKECW